METMEQCFFKAASWAMMTAWVFGVWTVMGIQGPPTTWASVLLFLVQSIVSWLIGCLIQTLRLRRAAARSPSPR